MMSVEMARTAVGRVMAQVGRQTKINWTQTTHNTHVTNTQISLWL